MVTSAFFLYFTCRKICLNKPGFVQPAIIHQASWGRFALYNLMTCQESIGVPSARWLHCLFPHPSDAPGVLASPIPLFSDALGMSALMIRSPAGMAVILKSLSFWIFARFATGLQGDRIRAICRCEVLSSWQGSSQNRARPQVKTLLLSRAPNRGV